MHDVDLKLLTIFQETCRTRSVSQAAEKIGVSQPTVSAGLAKLRKRFNDPLLVRTSRGMEPTPLAIELLTPVGEALGLLRSALLHQIVFDPERSDRRFHICLTDISQIVLLPRLLDHLKEAAPSIRIEVTDISAITPRLLESGEADLAIGFMPQLDAGFYQQKLFTQSMVCMLRKDHPRVGERLTLKMFVGESHMQVTTSGTGHGIIDKVLEEKQVKRQIALRVPSFLGIASIVANTDLLAIVPDRLAEVLLHSANVKILKPPIAFPVFAVKQHWHKRFHHDPGNRWLRNVVAELFLDSTQSEKRTK
jgi:DNA-binding transcriptional LysR family regulator